MHIIICQKKVLAIKQLAPNHHIVKCLKIMGSRLKILSSEYILMLSCIKKKIVVVVVVNTEDGNIAVVKEERELLID